MPPHLLVILDGFGYSTQRAYNAVYHTPMHTFNTLLKQYPHTTLKASGRAVGLPEGCAGNSEVGHATIGAGRVIEQPLVVINRMIEDGTFFSNPALLSFLHKVKAAGGRVHIMGLLSDSGSHSSMKHLEAFLQACSQAALPAVLIHAFLDGRDAPPRSAATYLSHLHTLMATAHTAKLASIQGRMYAMDRADNQTLSQQSIDLLLQKPTTTSSWQSALAQAYKEGLSDEQVPPTALVHDACIEPNDAIIMFNIRADRTRRITKLLLEKAPPLSAFLTATRYDPLFPVSVLYDAPTVYPTLLDVLQEHELSIFSCAESEKYAHVTYFFNGGRESIRPHEKRVIIPSYTPDQFLQHPAMKAKEITDAVIDSLHNDPRDFYLINYCNADMLGHTGNFQATVDAIQSLDRQLQRLYDVAVEQMKGALYITADHGNAETMWDNAHHQPHTSHTTNPVFFVAASKNAAPVTSLNGLKDIAPYIIRALSLPIPQQMLPHPLE